jgi:hypothetical protein
MTQQKQQQQQQQTRQAQAPDCSFRTLTPRSKGHLKVVSGCFIPAPV